MIELDQISKIFGYSDATTIANNEVSLKVKKGEFVAVMGPSGSGKTTLLNIVGLLDYPTSGKYTFLDQEVSQIIAPKRAKLRQERFGFIFQKFNLIPNLNVLDNTVLPLVYFKKKPERRNRQARASLERLGIYKKEYFYPNQLSGGQAQRVAIARALINNPDIIIADEPTGNLDSLNSEVIMNIFKNLNKEGKTILMVTHNPELTQYANRIIYMVDGKIKIDQKIKVSEQVDLGKIQDFLRQENTAKRSKKKNAKK